MEAGRDGMEGWVELSWATGDALLDEAGVGGVK